MKRYLIFFALSFASYSYGNLLDDWSNDDLCVWMEFAATPEYIQMDEKNKKVKFVRTPKFEEVPYPIVMEPNLVIEYYSR